MSDPVVKCDHCKQPGRRRATRFAPDHWFYMETRDAFTDCMYIIWACSEQCRDALWKRGPGPGVLEDDRSALVRQRKSRAVTLTAVEAAALRDARDAIGSEITASVGDGGEEWAASLIANLRSQHAVLDMLLATLAPKRTANG